MEKGKSRGSSKRSKATEGETKRVPSGYILFCNDERSKVVKANPDMKAKEVISELGKRWRDGSEAVRNKYNKLSEQMKAERGPVTKEPKSKSKSKAKDTKERGRSSSKSKGKKESSSSKPKKARKGKKASD